MMPLRKTLLLTAYRAASYTLFGSTAHADWAYEKMQRPSTAAALAMNLANYALCRPAVCRVVGLSIEPVFGCNLRCTPCWGGNEWEGLRTRLMEWELYCKAIDQAPRSVETVTLALAGEPLLHPRVAEMIDYAAARGLRVILYTNGTLLDSPMCERLAQTRLSVLNLSVETDPEMARRHRGVDQNLLRRYIEEFVAIKSPETAVNLSVVAHAGNVDRLSGVRRQWGDLIGHVKISPLLWIGEGSAAGRCFEAWRGQLTIFTNGDVTPCCFDVVSALAIGNLYEADLTDIINGDAYRSLLRSIAHGQPPSRCRSCHQYTAPGIPRRLIGKTRVPGR